VFYNIDYFFKLIQAGLIALLILKLNKVLELKPLVIASVLIVSSSNNHWNRGFVKLAFN
jgi:hypothetical protein